MADDAWGNLPEDVRRVLESARRNELGSPPRKHHLIPASYLRNWEEEGRIRVTHVDEDRRTYCTAAAKAARETDYYRLEADGLDNELVPPLLAETVLSAIEGWAVPAVAHLREHGARGIPGDLAAKLALFLGVQTTRGESFRNDNRTLMHEMFVLEHKDLSDDGIRSLLFERGIDASDAGVARARAALEQIKSGDMRLVPQDPAMTSMALEIAFEIGETFLARGWMVYRTPKVLVTCDEPVVTVGGPGFSREERAGLATAKVILLPLGPESLLAMFRPDVKPEGPSELDLHEVAEVNREILANTSRWAFERPSRRATLGLRVPPPARPFTTEGPFVVEHGDEERHIYRNFKPTRWAAEPDTPWPVARLFG